VPFPAIVSRQSGQAIQGRVAMAVATYWRWPGVSREDYDAVLQRLALDGNAPAGSILHIAALTETGIEVCDIWQTERAFIGFLEGRLMPAAQEVGIETMPEYRFEPLYNVFAADADMLDRMAAVSTPAFAGAAY
jgi:hypothetical protein